MTVLGRDSPPVGRPARAYEIAVQIAVKIGRLLGSDMSALITATVLVSHGLSI